MRLTYDEFERIEETAKKMYQEDYNGGIKLPTQQQVDEKINDLDEDSLMYLLCCLEEKPKNDEQNEILKYIRIKVNHTVVLSETEPFTVTANQMKNISQVVQYMGENVFADEWFPSMEDVERLAEDITLATVKFFVYIAHMNPATLAPWQADVQEHIKQIITDQDLIEVTTE